MGFIIGIFTPIFVSKLYHNYDKAIELKQNNKLAQHRMPQSNGQTQYSIIYKQISTPPCK